jgi:hypothetical protein
MAEGGGTVDMKDNMVMSPRRETLCVVVWLCEAL